MVARMCTVPLVAVGVFVGLIQAVSASGGMKWLSRSGEAMPWRDERTQSIRRPLRQFPLDAGFDGSPVLGTADRQRAGLQRVAEKSRV